MSVASYCVGRRDPEDGEISGALGVPPHRGWKRVEPLPTIGMSSLGNPRRSVLVAVGGAAHLPSRSSIWPLLHYGVDRAVLAAPPLAHTTVAAEPPAGFRTGHSLEAGGAAAR